VPLALGQAVELKNDVDLVGHEQRLDATAQAAQEERQPLANSPPRRDQ